MSSFQISRVPNTNYILIKFQENDWISWNGKDSFSISMDTNRWSNKVCGLCGNMNGNPLDDMLIKQTSKLSCLKKKHLQRDCCRVWTLQMYYLLINLWRGLQNLTFVLLFSGEITNNLNKFMDSWSVDYTCKTGPPIDYCSFLTNKQLTVSSRLFSIF